MIEVIDGTTLELTLEVGQGPAGPSTAVTEAAKIAAIAAADRADMAANRADLEAAEAASAATAAAGSAGSALASKDAAQSAADRAEMADADTQAAKAATLAALDEFRDVYLGSFASDPTTDNDGNPLLIGALYYNTATPQLKIYTAEGWNTAYFSPNDVVIQSELEAEILAHEQKPDPHPQYTTPAEAAAAAPVQFSFRNIMVSGQASVVADAAEDSLNLVAGTNIILTTDPDTDSVVITSTAQAAEASIAVFDEANLITSGATHFRFTGAGVTASATNGDVTISIPTFNAFAVVTGNTGTATADGTGDTIAITGGTGISTAATDTPDGLVITNTDRGSVAVSSHEGATDPHPQYTTAAEAAAAAPVQFAFQTVAGNTGSAVADAAADTLTIVGADGLSVTAAAATDTLTVQAAFATPGTIQPDATASAGSAASFARSDHRHSILTDPPVALGSAAAEGTSTAFARADHVHPYPTAAQIGAASVAFASIAVSGQSSVDADSASDTLTLVAGANITITTDAATDSITISSTGSPANTPAYSPSGDISFISTGGY